MKRLASILTALVLLASSPALRAQGDEVPTVPDDKQKAKEARIQEYLRKKEERLAAKETQRREREAEKAAAEAAKAEAPAEVAVAAAPAETGKLPRDLALAQDAVRHSDIGQDPTIQRYLDLIDRQEADAHQLAAFANFLADAGLLPEAMLYYSVALDLERNDPVLWVNAGTLQRRNGQLGAATSAFSRALQIDPNNALAHYNLATVYDEQGRYDDAIAAYTVALTLDPSLGDPRVNPQAANNKSLLAVKLMLYKQRAGSLGTPLIDVPEGRLTDEKPQGPQDPGD
jgi:tetratricopeptide (TPR) repeat protein